MDCLICGSASNAIVGCVNTTRRFDVVRCAHCNFVFAMPRPTEAELVEHYGADYFTDSNKEAGYLDYYTIGEMNMRAVWPIFKEYARIGLEKPTSILDIGCASGAFLDEARQDGWTAKGIELSDEAVQRAKEHYGLDVDQGDIFDTKLNQSSFHIVTMWHVLEHTLTPIDVLSRANGLLENGGLLFIEVPNWNSLGRIAKGMKWKQLVPPAHLNFFNHASMREALEQTGFEVVRCSSHHIAGFDQMKSRASGALRPALRGIEKTVESLGFGGYLRALGRKSL